MRKYLPWLSGEGGFALTTAAILKHQVEMIATLPA